MTDYTFVVYEKLLLYPFSMQPENLSGNAQTSKLVTYDDGPSPPRAQQFIRETGKIVDRLIRSLRDKDFSLAVNMACKVIEFSLKAVMYATCGLPKKFLYGHNIQGLAEELLKVSRDYGIYELESLPKMVAPMQGCYYTSQYPDLWLVTQIPSDMFPEQQAKLAEEIAKFIYYLAKDIILCV